MKNLRPYAEIVVIRVGSFLRGIMDPLINSARHPHLSKISEAKKSEAWTTRIPQVRQENVHSKIFRA